MHLAHFHSLQSVVLSKYKEGKKRKLEQEKEALAKKVNSLKIIICGVCYLKEEESEEEKKDGRK